MRHVTKLLKEGAPVNWSRNTGWTALHEACSKNRVQVVKVLLKHNPLINQQTDNGDTPLHWACGSGSVDCIMLLLATGLCDLG